jgi:hypothetical protein
MQMEKQYVSVVRKPMESMRKSEYKQLTLEKTLDEVPKNANLDNRLQFLLESYERLPNAITRHRLLETIREMAR